MQIFKCLVSWFEAAELLVNNQGIKIVPVAVDFHSDLSDNMLHPHGAEQNGDSKI